MGKDKVKCIKTDKNGHESVCIINRELVEDQLRKPKDKRNTPYKNIKIIEYLTTEPEKAAVVFTEAEMNEQAEKLAQEKFDKLMAEKPGSTTGITTVVSLNALNNDVTIQKDPDPKEKQKPNPTK
jgi:hypothetical protein